MYLDAPNETIELVYANYNLTNKVSNYNIKKTTLEIFGEKSNERWY